MIRETVVQALFTMLVILFISSSFLNNSLKLLENCFSSKAKASRSLLFFIFVLKGTTALFRMIINIEKKCQRSVMLRLINDIFARSKAGRQRSFLSLVRN